MFISAEFVPHFSMKEIELIQAQMGEITSTNIETGNLIVFNNKFVVLLNDLEIFLAGQGEFRISYYKKNLVDKETIDRYVRKGHINKLVRLHHKKLVDENVLIEAAKNYLKTTDLSSGGCHNLVDLINRLSNFDLIEKFMTIENKYNMIKFMPDKFAYLVSLNDIVDIYQQYQTSYLKKYLMDNINKFSDDDLLKVCKKLKSGFIMQEVHKRKIYPKDKKLFKLFVHSYASEEYILECVKVYGFDKSAKYLSRHVSVPLNEVIKKHLDVLKNETLLYMMRKLTTNCAQELVDEIMSRKIYPTDLHTIVLMRNITNKSQNGKFTKAYLSCLSASHSNAHSDSCPLGTTPHSQ
jgi:hypothetical protein